MLIERYNFFYSICWLCLNILVIHVQLGQLDLWVSVIEWEWVHSNTTGNRFFLYLNTEQILLFACQNLFVYIHPSSFTILNVHTIINVHIVVANISITPHIKSANINVTVHIKSANINVTVHINKY